MKYFVSNVPRVLWRLPNFDIMIQSHQVAKETQYKAGSAKNKRGSAFYKKMSNAIGFSKLYK